PPPRSGRLSFRRHPKAEIGALQVIGFLRHLNHELKGPCALPWDLLNTHRAQRTKQFVDGVDPLYLFFLPAYAPELKPVEYAWHYLKMNRLAKRPTFEIAELTALTHGHARSLQCNEPMFRFFRRLRPLSLRLSLGITYAGINGWLRASLLWRVVDFSATP
ncbi:MAG: transposase, partial [Acidobacteria bacterium]|nr:transposase [Acidobacteriota bacterium]